MRLVQNKDRLIITGCSLHLLRNTTSLGSSETVLSIYSSVTESSHFKLSEVERGVCSAWAHLANRLCRSEFDDTITVQTQYQRDRTDLRALPFASSSDLACSRPLTRSFHFSLMRSTDFFQHVCSRFITPAKLQNTHTIFLIEVT